MNNDGFQRLQSAEDASVNFVKMHPDGGMFEARYVRRSDEYVVVYLSSQTGCRQACRMCHLTATRQMTATGATREDFLQQAQAVLNWHDALSRPAASVHFNFMARGEPLENECLVNGSMELLQDLGIEATRRGMSPRFLVSTIMPTAIRGRRLAQFFPIIQPEIYYSIYSTSSSFRRRWLPRAMEVDEAIRMLSDYQQMSRKLVKLHWAFIEGQNDDIESLGEMCQLVLESRLRVDVNIVRFNPPAGMDAGESSEEIIQRNAAFLRKHLPMSRVDVVPRVGFDVKASCGMFMRDTDLER